MRPRHWPPGDTMMKSHRIKNSPKDECPRERLLAAGAENLTKADRIKQIRCSHLHGQPNTGKFQPPLAMVFLASISFLRRAGSLRYGFRNSLRV